MMEDAVKVNVYLKNIDDLAAVEDVRPLLHRHPCVPRRRQRCAAHGRVRADRRIFGNAEGTRRSK